MQFQNECIFQLTALLNTPVFNREAESEVPAEISAAWAQCLFLQAVSYLDNLPTPFLIFCVCKHIVSRRDTEVHSDLLFYF